jgi:hypothetical protein
MKWRRRRLARLRHSALKRCRSCGCFFRLHDIRERPECRIWYYVCGCTSKGVWQWRSSKNTPTAGPR